MLYPDLIIIDSDDCNKQLLNHSKKSSKKHFRAYLRYFKKINAYFNIINYKKAWAKRLIYLTTFDLMKVGSTAQHVNYWNSFKFWMMGMGAHAQKFQRFIAQYKQFNFYIYNIKFRYFFLIKKIFKSKIYTHYQFKKS